MSVELEGVSKTYGRVRALVGVTFSIHPGSITFIRGGNGSGKTTLLKIIGTLEQPTSGTVRYSQRREGREEVRARLGWLGHDALSYPDLSGKQNVEFAAALQGRDAADVHQTANRFRLEPFWNRPFKTYSRGQRQRIALASALVASPSLVLLDEPTTGLDREGQLAIAEAIEAERKRGAIVVVVSHDEELLTGTSAQIVHMERGRLVEIRET